MRVLLATPANLGGQVSGDEILTRLFLAHPPAGVSYEHYAAALAAGWVTRSHPLRAWAASLAMHSRPPAGVHYAWGQHPPLPYRLAGKLLPDRPDMDVLWLGAREARADLVHAYMHPVHLDGALKRLPLVLGNASGNADLLLHYYGLPPATEARLVQRDRALLRRFGIDHDLYHADRARLVTVPSRYAWRLHVEAGVPEHKLRLVRIGMPAPPLPERPPSSVCRFTLVGNGFERKGGPTLLKAFARLHHLHPEARLTLVSHVELPPRPGVELRPGLPHAEVLADVYPQTDVYVLPTRAEGYGMSVVEAMGQGLPVIATNISALPELVRDGVTGRLVPPDDEDALFEAMRALMEDPGLRARMGAAGRAAFLAEHSTDAVNPVLADVYREALG